MGHDLEDVYAVWLRRLARHELPREEARAVLPGLKARLEFLENLHSRLAGDVDLAEQARDIKREMEKQAKEIEVVEAYVGGPEGAECENEA